MSPEVEHRFDPLWMQSLTQVERTEVLEWLRSHGVNPSHCARLFLTPPARVRAVMYRVDPHGDGLLHADGEVILDKDRHFVADDYPEVIRRVVY